MRHLIVSYFDLCTGCRICELACSATKYGLYAPRKAHITVSVESEGLRSQLKTCIQCEESACMKACPTCAIQRDEKMGVVIINRDKCNGCGLCTLACPINAIKIEPIVKKAAKCDLCAGDPACVRYCPTKAIALI